jgi:hypothetical protein
MYLHLGLGLVERILDASMLDGECACIQDQIAGSRIAITGLADATRIDKRSLWSQLQGAVG